MKPNMKGSITGWKQKNYLAWKIDSKQFKNNQSFSGMFP
jgi:hypothetical protein